MFNRRNFTSYNGQERGSELLNEWKYVTSDGGGAVTGADYFKDVQKLLAVGDIIRVHVIAPEENSGEASYYCTSYDLCVRTWVAGHVCALPISVLGGQCELNNGTSGIVGTILMNTGYIVNSAYCILNGKVGSGSNTVTVKNGATVLYSGVLSAASADGSVITMEKNGSAGAALFDAAAFGISSSGATEASGSITVVLKADVTVPAE
jgi:hypothetical protein